MDESEFRGNITIVGLGLIGGSFAKALRGAFKGRLYGIDIDEKVLGKAIGCGVIDEGFTEPAEVLYKSDLVIIALYPQDTVDFLRSYAINFKKGSIITDTCGVKRQIIAAAREALPEEVEFVGGHPMAGNEFQGIAASSHKLFVDTSYIITPDEKNSSRGIATVEKLAAAIGCSSITKIGAEAHDRMITFTSHLPHIIAISFANLALEEKNVGAFAGRSFRDATRVAALNKKLWTQIFQMNKSNITDKIEVLEKMLRKLKAAVAVQDERILNELLDNAAIGKKEIG